MPKLLQINVTANSGSTGKIAEGIGKIVIDAGWESWIAYGRGEPRSVSNLIRIGSKTDMYLHGMESRLFDNHGRASREATKHLIQRIIKICPDVIHLHNIHGYYINYPLLFTFLKEWGGPVVWTLHDCWSFTGHCTHFMLNGCEKWQQECHKCPNLHAYPASLFVDNSKSNYNLKKHYFTSLGSKLTLVPVSFFVGGYLKNSFFKKVNMRVIHNGIDLNVFKPSTNKTKTILGVSNGWDSTKGLSDFFRLRQILPKDYRILLIGLREKQLKSLPKGIDGMGRTNGQAELAKLYSSSLALVNPTYEDNYPTVNLEAIACGTPVITYRTGGSPEAITPTTGMVVEQGDVKGIADGIVKINNGNFSINECRRHAETYFNQEICFKEYIDLYSQILRYSI